MGVDVLFFGGYVLFCPLQGHDDTSSDDDDGEGWGGGDGGGWTFDDIGEDEGNANHDADGVPVRCVVGVGRRGLKTVIGC